MGGELVGIRRVVVGKLPVCPRMNVVQVEIHGYCCQFMWGFSFRTARGLAGRPLSFDFFERF
jgi:hypothetical protein